MKQDDIFSRFQYALTGVVEKTCELWQLYYSWLHNLLMRITWILPIQTTLSRLERLATQYPREEPWRKSVACLRAVLKIVAEQIGSIIGGEIKLLCNLNDDLEDMRMTLESVLALLRRREAVS